MRSLPAILLAGALAAQASFQERVDEALHKARPRLLEFLDRAHGGELALLSLAALHDEVPLSNPKFRRALDRLLEQELEDTYGLALRLMVLAECPELEDRQKVAKADLKELLSRGAGDGGFSYRPGSGSSDLSNTQYAALGLRAAHAIGLQVKDSVWRRLLGRVLGDDTGDGGFSYQEKGASYSSMTVAGIAVLEICKQHQKLSQYEGNEAARALQGAWAWMDRHAPDLQDPKTNWLFYFLYGLERAAILSEREKVGDLDWYRAGAETLLRLQDEDGVFGGKRGAREKQPIFTASSISTAFAVLFLRRKFQREPIGAITREGGYTCLGLPDGSSGQQVEQAAARDAARGVTVVPDLLRALRSPIAARRRAATIALTKVCGRDFGLDPALAPERNSDALKAAELWWLSEGRKRK
jgi:hypothetical protein